MCVLRFRLSVGKPLSHQWSHFNCKTIRGSLCCFHSQRTLKETAPIAQCLPYSHAPAPVRAHCQIHVGVWISGPAFFLFQAPFPRATPWKDSEQHYPLVNFIYLNLSPLLIAVARDGITYHLAPTKSIRHRQQGWPHCHPITLPWSPFKRTLLRKGEKMRRGGEGGR